MPYMMNTSATEMYDGREIYTVRELTILPDSVYLQRARATGNVSIKLTSPEQVIILDYRRISQNEPVTTTASPVTTTATVQSTPDTPAPDNREETAPVMGERAFYN